MSALRNLKEATDAIYAVERPLPDYDWPVPLYVPPVPLYVPPVPLALGPTPDKTTLNRKDTGPEGVLVSFGGKSVKIRSDRDMADAFKLLQVAPLPMKALAPLPQPHQPTSELLPIDAPDVMPSVVSERPPAPMYATGIQQDARGWYLPVFGDPRMWELLHPKLKERAGYMDAVQSGKNWRIYLEPVMGSMSTAAMQLRGVIYGFDPFKHVIVADNDRDVSTTRIVNDEDGKQVRK